MTVAGFTTSISGTHDVIVRYLRFRAGDINCPSFQGDSLNVFESRDVIIDHVSASWSIDETLSVTHSARVTVQWSIIADSLNAACHAKGRHGYGSLLRYGDGGISFHHNLYAHHESRNPRLGDDLGLDFVNNVVYDWGSEPGYSGPASEGSPRLNYVANTLVAGPSTSPEKRKLAFASGSGRTEIYQQGNRIDAVVEGAAATVPGDRGLFSGAYLVRPERFPFPAVATDDAETAYHRVLADAGASLARDSVDTVRPALRRDQDGLPDRLPEAGRGLAGFADGAAARRFGSGWDARRMGDRARPGPSESGRWCHPRAERDLEPREVSEREGTCFPASRREARLKRSGPTTLNSMSSSGWFASCGLRVSLEPPISPSIPLNEPFLLVAAAGFTGPRLTLATKWYDNS